LLDIVLIAPPWPLFNRPSIQLGVLKAYLVKNLPKETGVKNLHPYLHVAAAIGFSNYHTISQSGWASEAVFAKALFPDMKGPEELFYSSLEERKGEQVNLDFQKICKEARAALEKDLESMDFSKTSVVGITVCLNQLTAGLFVAKVLKRQYPNLTVVMGGASVSGSLGQGILAAFPFVDFVIDGEGEIPLLKLCRYVLGLTSELDSVAIVRGGTASTASTEEVKGVSTKEQIKDLNSLPIPDFSDYFKELSQLDGAGGINVVLPIEASRGCWWGRCSFCNLNLQWRGYRAKGADRMAAEIDALCKWYSSIDFALMDNCLPKRGAAAIFERLFSHRRDYNIFAEIRAVHSKKELRIMKNGGLRSVQVGIEALTTSVLKRLQKGATAIENLAVMKNCAELGIELQSNLITCFPGTTLQEVDETINNLDFAWPFPTLKPVKFWLGMGSPVFQNLEDYGIKYAKAHRKYSLLFPQEVLESFTPLVFEYVGDGQRQEEIWRPVEEKLEYFSTCRKELDIKGSAITYRDGGHFLIIRQVQPDGKILTHRLSALSRQLYLMADEPVELNKLFASATRVPPDRVEQFVRQMADKRLMFMENGMVLSLACRDTN